MRDNIDLLAEQFITEMVEEMGSRADVEREVDLVDGAMQNHLTEKERAALIDAICSKIGLKPDPDYKELCVTVRTSLRQIEALLTDYRNPAYEARHYYLQDSTLNKALAESRKALDALDGKV